MPTMPFPLHSLAFIDGVGTPEMVMIFIVVLVLFGGQKLPEFARGLGKSIKEFKKAAAGVEEEFKRAIEEDEHAKSVPKIMPLPTTPAALPAPNVPVVTDLLSIPDSSPAASALAVTTTLDEPPSSGGETAPEPKLPAALSPATPSLPTVPPPRPSGPQHGKADV